jgi:hypothetical protein
MQAQRQKRPNNRQAPSRNYALFLGGQAASPSQNWPTPRCGARRRSLGRGRARRLEGGTRHIRRWRRIWTRPSASVKSVVADFTYIV